MHYTLTESRAGTIAQPPDLLDDLGRPVEIKAEKVPGGLLIRTEERGLLAGGPLAGSLEAWDAFVADLDPDAGFSREECASQRAERKATGRRRAEEVVN